MHTIFFPRFSSLLLCVVNKWHTTHIHTHTSSHTQMYTQTLIESSPRARWGKGHFNMSNAALLSGPAGGFELQQLGGSIAERQPEKYWTSQSASRDQLFPHQTSFLLGILLDHSLQGAQTCLRSPHEAPIQFQPVAGAVFVPFFFTITQKSLSNSTSLVNILLNNVGKWRRIKALEEEDKVKSTYRIKNGRARSLLLAGFHF